MNTSNKVRKKNLFCEEGEKMDEFTFYWEIIHECVEYVGKFAPLIVLAIVLFGFSVFYEKNRGKDE